MAWCDCDIAMGDKIETEHLTCPSLKMDVIQSYESWTECDLLVHDQLAFCINYTLNKK